MAKVKIQGHASGTGIITLTAPNTSTDRTVTLPDADVTLGASPVTALNNATANELVTVGSTTTELDAESALTYDGTTFLLTQASPKFKILPTTNGNDGVLEICGRSSDGSPTENRTQIKGEAEGSTANSQMSFHIENASGVNERLVLTSDGRGVSQFTAKAWGNANQSGTQALTNSHNISSISDVGSGKTRFTFANAMADTEYSCVASIRAENTEAEHVNFSMHTTGYVDIFNVYKDSSIGATFVDSQQLSMVTFGD